MGTTAYGTYEVAATIQNEILETIQVSSGPIEILTMAGAPAKIVDVSDDDPEPTARGGAKIEIRTSDGRTFEILVTEVH